MTRKKSEIKDKIVANVPLIWDAYPYATSAVMLVSFVIGAVFGAWWFD